MALQLVQDIRIHNDVTGHSSAVAVRFQLALVGVQGDSWSAVGESEQRPNPCAIDYQVHNLDGLVLDEVAGVGVGWQVFPLCDKFVALCD